ncbi:ABC transporter substrate-binding protein [Gemmatimonas sp.]|uniref:ABC transporter substrate-binding protein n=1 Tax=Gemmatimonas sp. TaxID=1962908 RepID=UPI0035657457
MATVTKPTNLDPSKPRAVTDYQIMYPQQGLLWRLDQNLIPRMDLLKDEKVSKDGLTITSTLKSGLKYSDGTPVEARDVVTSFNRWKASGQSSSFIAKVVGATATNATTVVWNLTGALPDWPYLAAAQFLYINPTDRLMADPVAYFKAPVSAGPMMLEQWTPGADTMTLTANPNYWAKSKVGKITIQAIPDGASRLLNLKQGAVDYVFDLAYTGVGEVEKNKVRVYGHPLPGTYQLTTNMAKKGPLQDVFARQAISAAIDRDKVAKIGFFGTVAPACANTFRVGNPYFLCALPSKGKQNLELARQLLAKSGTPNGFAFDLTVWARAAWPEAALIIAQDLAKIGITANITVKQDTVAIQDLQAGNYEMQFSGNNAPTPILQMLNWYSPGGAWTNWSKVNDPGLVATLNAAASARTPGQIRALLLKANQQAYGNSVHIPIADRAVISASRLPKGIMETTTPGEWLVVATTPSLSTQKAPPGIG